MHLNLDEVIITLLVVLIILILFSLDIVTGSVNPRTGNIASEKLILYFEQKIKSKDAQIEKLKVKNLSLKTQCQKMEVQLQHKEEIGEVFLPIDFDQLKIENQQYMEKIEERNNELLKLKVCILRRGEIRHYTNKVVGYSWKYSRNT